ncbi:MAG: glutamate 5-kinase [Syntrophorhabdaceae bacterium]|nr:glutamate 5-kinase [Syntrophorhabdaceae bacterium]MDD5243178.1 glutamate 5-kinase [Syntrophorhabdaceae bacterium]
MTEILKKGTVSGTVKCDTAGLKRIVVKIGTSVLVDAAGKISTARIRNISKQVKAVKDAGVEVIVVSSGAIACGMETLGLAKKPKEMAKRQALASIGQVMLMKMYMQTFEKDGLNVGQILLTHEDIKNRTSCLNLTNTLDMLISMDIVPVINENDALSFEEIRFGDNDNLSALIAQITSADLLLLLSDVEGLYERDPNRYPDALMIRVVKKVDEDIEKAAAGTQSEKSIGGMVSKLEAARKAGHYGIATRVVPGNRENVIVKIVRGEDIGTLFLPGRKLARRKWWTAFAFKVKGTVLIDEGAEKAVVNNCKSLLPSGIIKVEGHFSIGECIEVKNISGKVIARGITNYSSSDVEQIRGLKSVDIEKKLGYKYTEEVIHRDNMVVL